MAWLRLGLCSYLGWEDGPFSISMGHFSSTTPAGIWPVRSCILGTFLYLSATSCFLHQLSWRKLSIIWNRPQKKISGSYLPPPPGGRNAASQKSIISTILVVYISRSSSFLWTPKGHKQPRLVKFFFIHRREVLAFLGLKTYRNALAWHFRIFWGEEH